MVELIPIEHEGVRVLLTYQLAESYGTTSEIISNNFNRNKDRYQEGKHFFTLEGEEKHEFLNHHQFDDGSKGLKKAQKVYLWTEKGALLHAKSLNTDKAWEVYDYLVDFYFNVKQKSYDDLSLELQAFKQMFEAMAKTEREQKRQAQQIIKLEKDIQNVRDIFSVNNVSWRKDCGRIVKAVAYKLGGGDQYKEVNVACYKELEQTAHVNLRVRLNNLKGRMAMAGESQSVCNKLSYLDVIEKDPKLQEMYITIVKKLAIRYDINPSIAVQSNFDFED